MKSTPSPKIFQAPNYLPETNSQRGQILALLVDARGAWVPLPQILDLKISQYSARIHELRRLGFRIQNRTESIHGQRHSWFRLELGVGKVAVNDTKSETLFDLSPDAIGL